MSIAKELYYWYETKCRRCGHLTEWIGLTRKDFTVKEWWDLMHDKTANPRLDDCEKCEKKTVQDVVSYDFS